MAKGLLFTGSVSAFATAVVAEVLAASMLGAGDSLERVALVVGLVTFCGSFVSATFLLGGRYRDWSRSNVELSQKLQQSEERFEEVERSLERLTRALLRAGIIDEDGRALDHRTPSIDPLTVIDGP